MDIQVDCSCGQKFAIGQQYVGQAVACPTCGTAVVVPVPVRAAVQLEALPELRAQPTFSSYTLPAARGPSIFAVYKWWVVGALAIAVVIALIVGIVVGLIWLMSFLEPSAPGQTTPVPGVESQLPQGTNSPAQQPGAAPPGTAPPSSAAPGAVPPPAVNLHDDSEDFEGDATPPPSDGSGPAEN